MARLNFLAPVRRAACAAAVALAVAGAAFAGDALASAGGGAWRRISARASSTSELEG